ncbi:hypothetical protein OSB04_002829 [Centaurea solstitialis]|uniref:DUF4283 domain-containing protein n=1 Tax=Centaurea solstitialis TaxID=347529 RepID=A0AA38TTM7_9ASTR|nr:hypothetical protein OSB04_002829 [Centaurea solstitialis]
MEGMTSVDSPDTTVVIKDDHADDAPDETTQPPRVSIFKRLTPPRGSFADIVGNKVSNGLEFFPLHDRTSKAVPIPIELAREASKAFHTTIVGYFLGPRMPFPLVEKSLRTMWSKHGLFDVMMNSNGFFFIKFNDEGGSMRAVEDGWFMVCGVPMFVFPWDPSKGLSKPSHASCPLRIASAIGVPKHMDACTASMCDKRWGRPGFAKVLVDVWAIGELKKSLMLSFHIYMMMAMIRLRLLWNTYGNRLDAPIARTTCSKVIQEKKIDGKRQKEVDADGFVRVERKQWRNKEVQRAEGVHEASSSGTKDDKQQQDTPVDNQTDVQVTSNDSNQVSELKSGNE